MRLNRARRDSGFTLIEILVVLILVGMLVTVLFQGLSQAIRIRTNAGMQTAQLGRESMRRTWYRQLINGLVPDDDDGTARFEGRSSVFKGQSTNPIDLDTGIVLPVKVSLDIDATNDTTRIDVTSDSILDGPHTIALIVLPGTNFSFAYVDDDGSKSDVWPRRAIVQPPQLPSAIAIEDASHNQVTELLTASILGRRNPPPPPVTQNLLQQ